MNIKTISSGPTDGKEVDHAQPTVRVLEELGVLGQGTRGSVKKVVCEVTNPDGDTHRALLARKEYEEPSGAVNALAGHEFIRRNFSNSTKSDYTTSEVKSQHFPAEVYVDPQSNVYYSSILNEHSWVVSMGKNESPDRTHLKEHPVPAAEIRNAFACIGELFDVAESMGSKGISVGPDMYFFSIDHASKAMSYQLSDIEMTNLTDRKLKPYQHAVRNLYWIAGALNHFFSECVDEADVLLDRVRREVHARISAYDYDCPSDVSHYRAEIENTDALHGKKPDIYPWPSLKTVTLWKARLRWWALRIKRHIQSID